MRNVVLVDKAVLHELASLKGLFAQKVSGMGTLGFIIEFFKKGIGRLYFVYDQNPHCPSLHVQKEKPYIQKTSFSFILRLKKYALGYSDFFYNTKEDAIKINFSHNISLIINNNKHSCAGLFQDNKLLMTMPLLSSVRYFESFQIESSFPITLVANQRQAQIYWQQQSLANNKTKLNLALALERQSLKKKERLLANILLDRQKFFKSLTMHHEAELLRDNLFRVERGLKKLQVIDYSMDPPEEKLIALDPKLSAKDYVTKLFHKIKRAKRGLLLIEARITELEREIAEQKAFIIHIQESGDAPSLSITADALTQKAKSKKRLPYHEFISHDDTAIWVGRSAKDNDRLSFSLCKGNEWWLHARDAEGAHVIIKSDKNELNPKILLDAAMLAIHFSSLKNEQRAQVTYSRVKNLKKKKAMALGAVYVSKEKVIEVRMDKERLLALLKA
jgi:predicted ribosome quality control (RQC) complex YloA/Tae2 family protein